MRLFSILLICAFAFGTASSLSLRDRLSLWWTNIFGNARDKLINKICDYLEKYPARANTTIRVVNATLQETNRTRTIFVSTLNYLNSAENQQKLVNGTNGCPTFFSEIQQAIETDLKNAKENSGTARQKALDMVNKCIDELKKWVN